MSSGLNRDESRFSVVVVIGAAVGFVNPRKSFVVVTEGVWVVNVVPGGSVSVVVPLVDVFGGKFKGFSGTLISYPTFSVFVVVAVVVGVVGFVVVNGIGPVIVGVVGVVVVVVIVLGGKVRGFSGTGISYPIFSVILVIIAGVVLVVVVLILVVVAVVVDVVKGVVVANVVDLGGNVRGFSGTGIS